MDLELVVGVGRLYSGADETSPAEVSGPTTETTRIKISRYLRGVVADPESGLDSDDARIGSFDS